MRSVKLSELQKGMVIPAYYSNGMKITGQLVVDSVRFTKKGRIRVRVMQENGVVCNYSNGALVDYSIKVYD